MTAAVRLSQTERDVVVLRYIRTEEPLAPRSGHTTVEVSAFLAKLEGARGPIPGDCFVQALKSLQRLVDAGLIGRYQPGRGCAHYFDPNR